MDKYIESLCSIEFIAPPLCTSLHADWTIVNHQ